LRIEFKEQIDDTYAVLLNKRKLPMSLIKEDEAKPVVNILDFEKYEVNLNIYIRTLSVPKQGELDPSLPWVVSKRWRRTQKREKLTMILKKILI